MLIRENLHLARQGSEEIETPAGRLLLDTKGKADKMKGKSRVMVQKLNYSSCSHPRHGIMERAMDLLSPDLD